MSTVVDANPSSQVAAATHEAAPKARAFYFSLFRSGTLAFVLSLVAGRSGLPDRRSRAPTSELIRLGYIYLGLGGLLVAVVLALWCVIEWMAIFSKQWRMLKGD